MLAIISCTGTIHIEPSDDLRDTVIQPEYDLNVTGGVLTGDCDSVLGANGSHLRQDAVFDVTLNLLDLLEGLLFIESIEEDV